MLSRTCDGGCTTNTLSKTQLPSSWCVHVCVCVCACVNMCMGGGVGEQKGCGWSHGKLYTCIILLLLPTHLHQNIRWIPLLYQDEFAQSLVAMDTTHSTKQVRTHNQLLLILGRRICTQQCLTESLIPSTTLSECKDCCVHILLPRSH